ncbi:MAG: hypothetical protein ABW122_00365, partial [Ilumatobacteraceae bacterium]
MTATATTTAAVTAGMRAVGVATYTEGSPVSRIGSSLVTTATIGSSAVIDAVTAAITITAYAVNTASTTTTSFSAGGITVGVSRPTALVSTTTGTYLWGDVRGSSQAAGADSIDMSARSDDTATVILGSATGGVVTYQNAAATATVTTTVQSELGGRDRASTIATRGFVRAAATLNPLAVSGVRAGANGGVVVTSNKAAVVNKPTITLLVNGNARLTTGGNLILTTALNTKAPTVVEPDNSFSGTIDAGADHVTYSTLLATNLGNGDTVTVGGTNIGLVGTKAYNVIVDRIGLGLTSRVLFGNTLVDAYVDADSDEITFRKRVVVDGQPDELIAVAHNLADGDVLVYRANGSPIAGLVDGRSYRVSVSDANTIRLHALGDAVTPVTVANSAAVANTITVAHSFVNGQAVRYTVTGLAQFSSGLVGVAVDAEGNAIRDANNNLIEDGSNALILPEHGLVTGQEIVYNTSGAAIGGLTAGVHYFVIRLDANRIRLAATLCGAMGTCPVDAAAPDGPKTPIAPITVTANAEPSAAAVIHKLYAPTREPITGLVDNGVYYVVGATATSFQLAATVGGTALTLTVPAGAASGSGVLSSVPVDLTVSGNVTTGRLLFDIAGTGTVNLVLRHTTAASTISSTGQVSVATVNSSSGGFVSSTAAETTATAESRVAVTIGAGSRVTVGGDLTVTTSGRMTATADSSNGGKGGISVGSATATANTTSSTTVTIGSGAIVSSAWNITLAPVTEGARNTYATANGRGILGSGVTARSRGTLDLTTTIDIRGSLLAGHLLSVTATTTPFGEVIAYANASGIGADADSNDCDRTGCGMTVVINADITVSGTGTELRGDEIT